MFFFSFFGRFFFDPIHRGGCHEKMGPERKFLGGASKLMLKCMDKI